MCDNLSLIHIFTVPEAVRQQIFESSIRLVKKVGYRNAGTLEFLVDDQNHPYFIEMNPRIQVEHTVSEMITGIDIVQSQIMVAEGYPLDSEEIGIPNQDAIQVNGYSIQTRITTEDPANNFLPDTGRINVYRSGSGAGLRLDGGNAYSGAEILPYYDSLLDVYKRQVLTGYLSGFPGWTPENIHVRCANDANAAALGEMWLCLLYTSRCV